VEIKCQLDATEVFIADLIACLTCFGHHYAHHQELKTIIQWLLPVVFGALDTKPSGPHQTNNLKAKAPNTTSSSHCIIVLSSWWWA